jgi:serralysin
MFRRDARLAGTLAALITVAVAAVMTGGSSVAETKQPAAGPDTCSFTTELLGRNPHLAMKNAARILKTECGYRYRAGQQDSHLVITQVGDKLRFADRGTDRIDTLPAQCKEIKGVRGIAAKCPIPYGISEDNRLLVEVWPRLGDDFVDGSTLSAEFSMTVLGDGGDDTALLGSGPDFFNGASGKDRVRGGAGDDWIRTGDHRDRVKGGPGRDHITGGYGTDTAVGGEGADRIYCGGGRDRAVRDRGDLIVFKCESITSG